MVAVATGIGHCQKAYILAAERVAAGKANADDKNVLTEFDTSAGGTSTRVSGAFAKVEKENKAYWLAMSAECKYMHSEMGPDDRLALFYRPRRDPEEHRRRGPPRLSWAGWRGCWS